MHRPIPLVTALALVAASATVARAQAAADAMAAVSASALVWNDAKVPGFDPGMKIAVIHGNPDSAGAYTLRLSFPDGYRFPAHWHPMPENVTVLQGTLLLAMGERAQEAGAMSYDAGAFLYVPAKQPHYGGARGPTVIQLHGVGPFAINLVNPPAPGEMR